MGRRPRRDRAVAGVSGTTTPGSKTADAVVIGGGIMGASAAHFLAKRGFGRVVLLEKGRLAGVSTGHSAAIIRTYYSNPITLELAKRALHMFENDRNPQSPPSMSRSSSASACAPPGSTSSSRSGGTGSRSNASPRKTWPTWRRRSRRTASRTGSSSRARVTPIRRARRRTW
ncbi:MAG: FAD-binding oxidoreductase [Gemmatimonadales bacterium]|nr:FAD-binding oxidoreductase [Gemmatimonadales bacterium]